MTYKLISEWRRPDGFEYEIVVFKYNISHDEKVVYSKIGDILTVKHFYCYGEPNKTEYYGEAV